MELPMQISFADASGQSFPFNTLETLKSFIETEIKFWMRILLNVNSDSART